MSGVVAVARVDSFAYIVTEGGQREATAALEEGD